MFSVINQAMIFAAGFGKRLKHLTDHIPKPLISLGSTTCLDLIIKRLEESGIQKIVINTHHLANQIHDHLNQYPDIIVSYEKELLETGGGLLKALPYFNNQPFFTINGDVWWQQKNNSIFKSLQNMWDSNEMDVLLLVVPKDKTIGYTGVGDYNLFANRLTYRNNNHFADFVYAGISIINPKVFQKNKSINFFSMKTIFDEAEAKKRLFGCAHQDTWADIGTLDSLEKVRNLLKDNSQNII